MPDRIDRRIEGNNGLLITVLAIVGVAVATGIYLFGRMSAPASQQTQTVQAAGQVPVYSAEPVSITLSVPDAAGMLTERTVSISPQMETQAQARELLITAFADEHFLRNPVLNRFKLRAFFLDRSGTGYVDLGQSGEAAVSASAIDEFIAVYALVNTLTRNFQEIRQVRFLVDGREARTLAGHIDVSNAFVKRLDLVRQ